MLIPDRIRLWREDAAVLRRRGARRAAALLERLAAELEEDWHAQDARAELVDLRRAVELSGYTRGHLRRMIVDGDLTNHGSDTRPLVCAAELPRKVARRPIRVAGPAVRTRSELADEVLSR
jgi:hypothetical protein